jgi:hypothetical protein
MKALERLNRYAISTTLVVTLRKGLNDREIGRIIDFAIEQPCVRGVTFQPIQHAGRADGFDPSRDRLTLTEVRRRILEQTQVFRPEDVIPVPCHPDSLAMAYALKVAGKITPLTGLIEPDVLINGGRNTIVFEQDDAVREGVFKLFATNHSPQSGAATLRELLCCLPSLQVPQGLGYENIFRVLIMEFIDHHAFDVRSVKKSCVHIVHPKDGGSFRSIPTTCSIATIWRRVSSSRSGDISRPQGSGLRSQGWARPQGRAGPQAVDEPRAASAAFTRSGVNGTVRMRAPVASKIALPIAAATTVIDVSPEPQASSSV